MASHMTADEFRRHGHQLVDWVADYWSGLGEGRVTPDLPPGAIASLLPTQAPDKGEGFDAIVADLDTVVTPGLTHWQHPNFYAYFPANTSGPSVLADLVCAGLGVQCMLWATSPACTELETVMLDWLADLLGLPERFRSSSAGGGVIQDSASSATLVATLVALYRASGGRWRTTGIDRRYTVYTSTQGHSSIEKAVRLAGLGDDGLRLIDVDSCGSLRPEPEENVGSLRPEPGENVGSQAMDPAALRSALVADREADMIPALVVATIGTTSTTAIDPLPEIAAICQEFGVWLHVDAAYAGAAAVCPELRWTHTGLEFADSYCFDPHKWLLTGFDCDAFWVADRAELIQALSVLPEFLRNAATESGAVIDYRDWQVPLGRRMRALKLWFVLRWYGAVGLREHIRSGISMAQEFASWVRADERFEVVAPHPFSLVCFRLRGQEAGHPSADIEAANEELLRRINASGAAYLSHTKVDGRFTLRMAIGSPQTTMAHVTDTWRRIQSAADVVAPR
jgi:aromatic-L-amino-acid/L-tryptophan decarboxylase